MKDLFRIYRRYILNAVLIVFLVLLVNFFFFAFYVIREYRLENNSSAYQSALSPTQLSAALTADADGSYSMSEADAARLDSRYAFAMLIAEDGQVVWSHHLPEEIPLSYSLTDVAALTRWYLKGYPVRVHTRDDGLFVLASPKDSIAKYALEFDTATIYRLPSYLAAYLICNLLLILALTFLLGNRFYRSLKVLASGIDALQEQTPLHLPETGTTSTLAHKLNAASALLAHQKAALEKRDSTRTEWIAGVSHDIRTPLSLIMGHASSLSESPLLDESGQREALLIQENSLRIRDLIADLNLTSRLAYDAYPLRLAPCSPAALLRNLAAEYLNGELADSERYFLSLKLDAALETVQISADEGLLIRAFRNLIGNSIRHNPEGCEIQIAAFLAGDEKKELILQFSDTGVGIPARVLDLLSTEPASESSATLSRPHIMGLRVVRQIIEAHGGMLAFLPEQDPTDTKKVCRTIQIILHTL